MGLILREKAEHLATFPWPEVFPMETHSRWVPTTQEMEVQVLTSLWIGATRFWACSAAGVEKPNVACSLASTVDRGTCSDAVTLPSEK